MDMVARCTAIVRCRLILGVIHSCFFCINCETEGDVPLRILGLVTSLAVTFRKVDVLQCIAVWMSVSNICSVTSFLSVSRCHIRAMKHFKCMYNFVLFYSDERSQWGWKIKPWFPLPSTFQGTSWQTSFQRNTTTYHRRHFRSQPYF